MNPTDSVPASTTEKRRPVFVWVILLFYGLSTFSLLLLTVIRVSGNPLVQARLPVVSYTWFDYAESYGLAVLKLVAAIELFRLRRLAVPLFAAVLILNIAAAGFDLFSKTSVPVPLWGILVGFSILGAICLYSWWLARKGVLI
jgi:hypothetical protein